MTRALIIADPQRDICEGGSLGVGGGAAGVSRIDRLLNSDHGYAQVIASCDHHIDPGGHFAAEPDFVDSGYHTVWSAQRALSFMTTSPTVTSPPSSTRATTRPPTRPSGLTVDGKRLSAWLRERKVDQIDVCGIATDYCVRATALDGVREGFDTTVLLDLTAAVAPERVVEVSAELAVAGVAIRA
jgi:nicotinamidase/pyrazinamidase